MVDDRTETSRARKTPPSSRCADRPQVRAALYAKPVQLQKFSAGGRRAARFLGKAGQTPVGSHNRRAGSGRLSETVDNGDRGRAMARAMGSFRHRRSAADGTFRGSHVANAVLRWVRLGSFRTANRRSGRAGRYPRERVTPLGRRENHKQR